MGNTSSKSHDGDSRPRPAPPGGINKFKKALPSHKPASSSGGQTLGGGPGASDPDARASAARAAEERANKAAGKGGRLQSQLAAQKKQTRNQTLDDVSWQNQRTRDADEAAEARNWS